MNKILGIDMGTSSIGLTVRNIENSNNIVNQLELFSSVIFKSGAGKDDKGFTVKSYAGERTSKRSPRRLYQARKYRIWETLKVLIKYKLCPLSSADLDKWCKYDKEKGLKREYPIDANKFEQWIRLDFNGDGQSDYSSPYQLRAELATEQLDFSIELNRFKLGRALYHIAQRRGFKSSKGETIKEQEQAIEHDDSIKIEEDLSLSLKKSEENKAKDLVQYINVNNFLTVGCAFAQLEKEGIRIRASKYEAVRSLYIDEIKRIFDFQKELHLESDSFKEINKAIFYKRPLRSQKGLIGKCTLEPSKSRCAISHPEFEEFRAWSFINNIKYRKSYTDEWLVLTKEQKNKLFENKFMRTLSNFKFEEIRVWIEKVVEFPLSYKAKTINYKENTSVSACPISGRIKNLLGENWKSVLIQTDKTRINQKTGEEHSISYNYEDIWHICFSYEDAEQVEEFAKLNLNNYKTHELIKIWGAIQQGYAQLSLKAIKNINRFLKLGLIYSEAALIAKLPEIFGEERWNTNEKNFLLEISSLIEKNRNEKRILSIANNLIANYKSLNEADQFAYKNISYVLDISDLKDIDNYSKESFGQKTWYQMSQNEKNKIIAEVTNLYQDFFATSKRDFYHLPKLGETIKSYLSNSYEFLHCSNNFIDKQTKLPCTCKVCNKLSTIYHPSMIEFYKPVREQQINYDGIILSKRLLESPVIGALKNPMVMRVMHILRKQINTLILDEIIDEDTRIVVETARDFNDANMRWAIEAYQREREKENKEFAKSIQELYKTEREINDEEIEKARLLVEQHEIPVVSGTYKKSVEKYRLWLEQGCQCIYTGKIINLTKLLSENGGVDFEHTIPRSISFDDSLANLTVCDLYYNRKIKKNQIPTQLPNYDKDYEIDGVKYTAILPRLEHWKEKVEAIKDNVASWKAKAKRAQEKDSKDYAIRQRHLWELELEYWKIKLERFTMVEVTSGFKNSQLVDTRIITKYAYHYLKSAFNNVEVQKGTVTASFRKILGVQSLNEKKNRDKHSHHAIDAAILTLIPTAAKREKMLELFYKIDEEKELGHDVSFLEIQLEKEKRNCNLSGNLSDIISIIEDNILINHISKDQSLTPANKKVRIKGQIVPFKDSVGKIIYQTNEDGSLKYRKHKDGNPIYKKDEKGNFILENGEKIKIYLPEPKYKTGDCIRGQLHGDTFYGAIKQVQKDENNKFIRDENGKMVIGAETYYVVRRELKYKKNALDKGFASLDDLESKIVDKHVFEMIKSQCVDGNFKDACEDGFYMLDKKGNKVNKIRHIRCKTSIKNPLAIKKQTYLSDKDYKQFFYTGMGDLYVMCKYESDDNKNKEFVIYSLFNISENRKNNIEDVPTIIESKKKRIKLRLKTMIKVGDKFLLYKNRPEDVIELAHKDQLKRLYIVRAFENGGNRIVLKHHLNSQEDKVLGLGNPIADFENLPPKIRCSINTLTFLKEEDDFVIKSNGEFEFTN